MTRQLFRQWSSMVLVALGCGALGWLLGHSAARRSTSMQALAASAADQPAPHTLLDAGPVIVVASDGRVTLHVDHESLSWVLAEIDRQNVAQGGGSRPSSPAGAAVREGANGPATASNPQQLLARVLRGSETERYESLIEGRSGGALSEDVLKTLYETDASPRVRHLAFEYSLEGTEVDPAARRSALLAASLLPDPVVSQDASRLLALLDHAEAHQPAQAR